ncbi:MAG: hypothetical protein DME25_10410 [Verrucomicrobia bacterium]|nr:MAG: hypothetical protein DME25_10410 [Verrucomicrobiota bacterium]
MDFQPPKYRREFFTSPHHAGLGLVTLGAGFILGAAYPLALLLAPAAYLLGWVYFPDMPFFRRWVDRRHASAQLEAGRAEAAQFTKRREELLAQLSGFRRQNYRALANVCQDIETASADQPLSSADPTGDPRLRKLDELMWTFLRLLTMGDSLDRFLETERREEVPRLVQEAEEEVAGLSAEFESLKAKGGELGMIEAKERFLSSRLERLEVLRKRQQRIGQAQANLQLVVSEQERLEQQVKLLRADAIASKNADTLTARIDATVEHLDQTNQWLAEMDEFKDLAGDLPATPERIGYAAAQALADRQMPPRLPREPGRLKEKR